MKYGTYSTYHFSNMYQPYAKMGNVFRKSRSAADNYNSSTACKGEKYLAALDTKVATSLEI